MKKIILISLISMFSLGSFGQLKTDNAFISFYSELEDLTVENTTVSSSLDVESGELNFKLKISAFSFLNKTMQKHFNQEGIMNSAEFPIANFSGTIGNNSSVDYTTDGTYEVEVSGKMTIKGVSKEFSTKGKIIVKDGKISAAANFDLNRFDYSVSGKEQSISKILTITVMANY
jgi:polyisoprenoid-binding protein YceI